jgi:DNA replication and repair protein RecF
MFLEQLHLINFKNHTDTRLVFDKRVNIFTGNNGMGKTNLLDAIHLLCFGKSYFTSREMHIRHFDATFYRVSGKIRRKNRSEKVVVKQDGKTKTIEVDDVVIPSLLEFLGNYPVTMICPGDIELITGGSELRRKFLDQLLCQLDKNYLSDLILYNKVLKQRNALLKNGINRPSGAILLEPLNRQMIPPGIRIYQRRKEFLADFAHTFQQKYTHISNDREVITLVYQSALDLTEFEAGFSKYMEKDILLKRTTFGIHRDDISLELDGFPVNKTGSQGQIKTAVLALKLAQLDTLYQSHLDNPILLLDDIFDKLDPDRIKQLLTELIQQKKGQLFITDAFKHRLGKLLEDTGIDDYCLWEVINGKVIK